MTIVFERPIPDGEPAVHALVVAVGAYPHLAGGLGEVFAHHQNMGQLSSPVPSAMAFVDWLKYEYRPASGALATIDVLCSPGGEFETGGVPIIPESPTRTHVEKAVLAWKARGEQSESNVLIFYFCGHGIVCGAVELLLLEDIARNVNDPFQDAAINTAQFMNGMAACAAQTQLFLLDACRTVYDLEGAGLGEPSGTAFVRPRLHTNLGITKQLCVYGTGLGASAYGRPHDTSLFTEALLAAMRGSAARQDDDDSTKWMVAGGALQEGVNVQLRRHLDAKGQYVQSGRLSSEFTIHALPGPPTVPVRVMCRPDTTFGIELSCQPSGQMASWISKQPWFLDLAPGAYSIRATDSGTGAVLGSSDFHPLPPICKVDVQV